MNDIRRDTPLSAGGSGDIPATPRASILVINCGSSSIKFAVFGARRETLIISGLAERLGSPEARMLWKIDGERHERSMPGADLEAALRAMLEVLPPNLQLLGIGHRVVHGAEEFSGSVLIDDAVLAAVERCVPLAPLHNPANLAGIRAARHVFPDTPQVAVFDTAFHQTLPRHAYLYAVPREWYTRDRVRRYGFHGTSHRYVSAEAARRLGKDPSEIGLITAHLGNGCSACAVDRGRSVDTTMGISPLEGLVMGTRSGDIDPALHEYMAARRGWDLPRIMRALNRESGLLGLSGLSNDMRTLVEAADNGNDDARLAIDVFCYRLAKAISALSAALSRLDAIVFTGGIGEHSPVVRARTAEHLHLLGVDLDPELNAANGEPETGRISKSGARTCLVIPTNEELMIARDTLSVIRNP
ncbi:MAG: acetate kinase [Verrucomicrobia bacterium]|nr:MAG: acetate kinase [Verrucomicrobiota bacterium]